MVAGLPVHRAGAGIAQEPARLRLALDPCRKLQLGRKRCLAVAVGDQLQREEEAAPAEVADAFCATRLGADGGGAFGALPSGLDVASLVERATPQREVIA